MSVREMFRNGGAARVAPHQPYRQVVIAPPGFNPAQVPPPAAPAPIRPVTSTVSTPITSASESRARIVAPMLEQAQAHKMEKVMQGMRDQAAMDRLRVQEDGTNRRFDVQEEGRNVRHGEDSDIQKEQWGKTFESNKEQWGKTFDKQETQWQADQVRQKDQWQKTFDMNMDKINEEKKRWKEGEDRKSKITPKLIKETEQKIKGLEEEKNRFYRFLDATEVKASDFVDVKTYMKDNDPDDGGFTEAELRSFNFENSDRDNPDETKLEERKEAMAQFLLRRGGYHNTASMQYRNKMVEVGEADQERISDAINGLRSLYAKEAQYEKALLAYQQEGAKYSGDTGEMTDEELINSFASPDAASPNPVVVPPSVDPATPVTPPPPVDVTPSPASPVAPPPATPPATPPANRQRSINASLPSPNPVVNPSKPMPAPASLPTPSDPSKPMPAPASLPTPSDPAKPMPAPASLPTPADPSQTMTTPPTTDADPWNPGDFGVYPFSYGTDGPKVTVKLEDGKVLTSAAAGGGQPDEVYVGTQDNPGTDVATDEQVQLYFEKLMEARSIGLNTLKELEAGEEAKAPSNYRRSRSSYMSEIGGDLKGIDEALRIAESAAVSRGIIDVAKEEPAPEPMESPLPPKHPPGIPKGFGAPTSDQTQGMLDQIPDADAMRVRVDPLR